MNGSGLGSEQHRAPGRWRALYAFGNSYSDSGAGYVDGNGPTAIVYMAEKLGIKLRPANIDIGKPGSLNFAISGAQTGLNEGFLVRPLNGPHGSECLLGRGMTTQVLDFAQRVTAGVIDFRPDQTLFFLAGGLNDGLLPTEATIANLKRQVQILHETGARHILIALLPTKFPIFGALAARLNPAIADLVSRISRVLEDASVTLIPWGEEFDRVFDDAADYGITNKSGFCACRALFGEDPTPRGDPDTFFFYHAGHPSTAVHRLVGLALAASETWLASTP